MIPLQPQIRIKDNEERDYRITKKAPLSQTDLVLMYTSNSASHAVSGYFHVISKVS